MEEEGIDSDEAEAEAEGEGEADEEEEEGVGELPVSPPLEHRSLQRTRRSPSPASPSSPSPPSPGVAGGAAFPASQPALNRRLSSKVSMASMAPEGERIRSVSRMNVFTSWYKQNQDSRLNFLRRIRQKSAMHTLLRFLARTRIAARARYAGEGALRAHAAGVAWSKLPAMDRWLETGLALLDGATRRRYELEMNQVPLFDVEWMQPLVEAMGRVEQGEKNLEDAELPKMPSDLLEFAEWLGHSPTARAIFLSREVIAAATSESVVRQYLTESQPGNVDVTSCTLPVDGPRHEQAELAEAAEDVPPRQSEKDDRSQWREFKRWYQGQTPTSTRRQHLAKRLNGVFQWLQCWLLHARCRASRADLQQVGDPDSVQQELARMLRKTLLEISIPDLPDAQPYFREMAVLTESLAPEETEALRSLHPVQLVEPLSFQGDLDEADMQAQLLQSARDTSGLEPCALSLDDLEALRLQMHDSALSLAELDDMYQILLHPPAEAPEEAPRSPTPPPASPASSAHPALEPDVASVVSADSSRQRDFDVHDAEGKEEEEEEWHGGAAAEPQEGMDMGWWPEGGAGGGGEEGPQEQEQATGVSNLDADRARREADRQARIRRKQQLEMERLARERQRQWELMTSAERRKAEEEERRRREAFERQLQEQRERAADPDGLTVEERARYNAMLREYEERKRRQAERKDLEGEIQAQQFDAERAQWREVMSRAARHAAAKGYDWSRVKVRWGGTGKREGGRGVVIERSSAYQTEFRVVRSMRSGFGRRPSDGTCTARRCTAKSGTLHSGRLTRSGRRSWLAHCSHSGLHTTRKKRNTKKWTLSGDSDRVAPTRAQRMQGMRR